MLQFQLVHSFFISLHFVSGYFSPLPPRPALLCFSCKSVCFTSRALFSPLTSHEPPPGRQPMRRRLSDAYHARRSHLERVRPAIAGFGKCSLAANVEGARARRRWRCAPRYAAQRRRWLRLGRYRKHCNRRNDQGKLRGCRLRSAVQSGAMRLGLTQLRCCRLFPRSGCFASPVSRGAR